MHLTANTGPNYDRQHLFSAQQRAHIVPNSGFLTPRMVCRGAIHIPRGLGGGGGGGGGIPRLSTKGVGWIGI